LVHRRLAVVDLTESGKQPMLSASGRYVLIFNGEIYNHRHIRQSLEHEHPVAWRGTSDTEVLLAAIDAWGLNATLSEIRGMFAIALYDRVDNKLVLIRDRFGEKPLYYGLFGDRLVFGSELHAFRRYPDLALQVDKNALALYFRRGHVPSPFSIYENVYKVEPGYQFSSRAISNGGWDIQSECYYSAIIEQPTPSIRTTNHNELKESFKALIVGVVGEQLQADVPVGIFLSGGIDSSLITAAALRSSVTQINTYCMGFDDPSLNEAPYASQVAKYLGSFHHEMYVTEQDAINIAPTIATIYDEPFADSSQIPMFLVAKLAKQHCTVALSGDGGDELFGGYQRYQWNLQGWKDSQRLPYLFRSLAARILVRLPPQALNTLYSACMRLWHRNLSANKKVIDFKLLKEMLLINDFRDFYEYSLSTCFDADELAPGCDPAIFSKRIVEMRPTWQNTFLRYMMAHDARNYLPNDILVKVDRAAMANSLETRAPFLDTRVVHFSTLLPDDMLVENGRGKAFLRNVLCDWLPMELVERPKRGFGVPLAQWLRGPLKAWAWDSLRSASGVNLGIQTVEYFSKLFEEHLTGERDWSVKLWAILMYINWYAS